MNMPPLSKILIILSFISKIGAVTSISNIAPPRKDDTAWGEIGKDIPSTPRVPVPTESVEEVDIAIVGGGLVGLALGIGLAKAGVRCKIYERSPQLRSASRGILAIRPIGMQALEAIHPDIPDKAAAVGCELQRTVMTRVDADGNTENIVNERFGQERIGIGIAWHKMQQVLASLLPPGVVQTGRGLSTFTEEDKSVLLHFEGGECVRCQAALMCDGVFSIARKQMFPDDKVIDFGQLNWGSVIRTDSLPPALHPPNAVRLCTYSGDPKWMAFLNDGGNGYTFFQLRISDPDKALALSGNEGRGGLGLTGVHERLSSIVKPCKDVASALASIPEEQLFERCIVARRAAPTWLSAGKRVVLVGDSAHGQHPKIGHGANTGFLSARNMIRALKACNGDWRSGLVAYERAHKPRIDLIQAFANLMGCTQTQQKQFLPKEVMKQMLEWTNTGDATKLPPEWELSIIRSFDPLAQKGISCI